MASVHPIAPQHRTIAAPEELRKLQGWLIWRSEFHEGETKPRKVPYYCDGGIRYGKHGAPRDRAKLVTFEAARDAAARRGFDGVGLALMPEWGITALDFDNCTQDGGKLPDEITEIAGRTYTEHSPSGQGIRAFVKGAYGNRKAPTTGGDYGFETFQSKGFVTFTGHVLPLTEMLGCENTVASIDALVAPLVEKRFARSTSTIPEGDDFMAGLEKPLDLTLDEVEHYINLLDPDMGRDPWVRVGMAAHHQTGGDIDGFAIWDAWSAQGSKYPGEEALQAQWESFTRREGERRRQVTMASVIKMANEASQTVSTAELQAVVEQHQQTTPTGPTGAVETPAGFEGMFPVYSAGALAARPPGEWLIKNVLPMADLGILYGAPGSGKTFLGIDLLAAIARGVPWRGQRVRKGRCIIVSAEGGAGMGKRLEAYCLWNNIDTSMLDIGVITAQPNLLDKANVIELVKAIMAAGGADLIMWDTVAQVTPGANENAADDMGLALANARAIREATGAFNLLIAHTGKDATRGIRGWSGFNGAADVVLEAIRHENGQREMRIAKMKDGDDELRWGFKLEIMQTGTDSDGDAITSCIAVETDAPQIEAEPKGRTRITKHSKWMRHILEVVDSVYADVESVPFRKLVDVASEMIERDTTISPETGKMVRDRRPRDMERAIKALCKGPDSPMELHGSTVVFYTGG